MEAERFRPWWFPQHVVLADAGPRPAGERRAQSANLLLEYDARGGAGGLPAVADLARAVGQVAPGAPVPFIRIQAGLEFAAEQWLEARARRCDFLCAQEVIEDQEAVGVELLDLSRGELHHLERSNSVHQRRLYRDPGAQQAADGAVAGDLQQSLLLGCRQGAAERHAPLDVLAAL